ncbi:adenylate kinase [Pseudanabaena sp. PCC 6802]|uniref:adenylate kinase n=1 Tax=Pseudanabaena sp. PCC 6802 TaxID=118173 RepID=UPI0003780A5F|nr:adenylate kinase [Pseudanabaena sp. PCC 6802]
MPRIILMGPPGSGKGTQGEILAQDLGIPRISPGDIFRAEIKQGTELGKQVQAYNDSGALVPDEVVIEVMRSRFSKGDTNVGWILDGFPRTTKQARALNDLLAEIDQKYDFVLNLDVPDRTLIERLALRSGEQGRSDDNEAVIENRLKEYYEKTRPLLEFYGKDVTPIDGTPSMAEVSQAIKTKLSQH